MPRSGYLPLMSRIITRAILFAWVISGYELALAETSAKLPLVAQLWFADSPTTKPWEAVFRGGLRDLGYVEGKNITIVARYADGDSSRLPTLVNELIALRPDVILVSGNAIRAAMAATRTIPLVSFSMGNAVQDGLVSSLARPGGNLTGMYSLGAETTGKRLELAMELIPVLKRVGVIFDSSDRTSVAGADILRSLAPKAGLTIHAIGVHNWDEIQAALKLFEQEHSQALIVSDNPFFYAHRERILQFADHRFPVVAQAKDWAKAGALITYAPDYYDMLRRTAVYVDKILHGIKAGDIAVEQATRFELVVNLRIAKAFGLLVPESVLVRADEVVR
jgi:putative ABC transport system substrate-binding protein